METFRFYTEYTTLTLFPIPSPILLIPHHHMKSEINPWTRSKSNK